MKLGEPQTMAAIFKQLFFTYKTYLMRQLLNWDVFDFSKTSWYDTSMNQPRILVVEDEEYLRELYEEILLEQGFYVETAVDGNEGMVKMRKGGWDLVLLDVILPGMDGIEIMRVLKSSPPQVPNKKVIFLTNLDKDKEMGQALALGNGYIIKSQVTPDVLMGKIRTYLNVPVAPPPIADTPAGTVSESVPTDGAETTTPADEPEKPAV